MRNVARGNRWTLYHADWRDVLQEIGEVDALITDPPYSERTHKAHDTSVRRGISYEGLRPEGVDGIVASLVEVTHGWCVVITDDELFHHFRKAFIRHGRYAFQPVPIVSIGGRVRLAGDGPSSWTVWCCVSRPRCEPFTKWGTLPGAYIERGSVKGAPIIGAKQLTTMRRIVRDYTRPDDVVLDPFAGTGTTLLAAMLEGRRAIGCEVDRKTYEYAVKRLRGKLPVR